MDNMNERRHHENKKRENIVCVIEMAKPLHNDQSNIFSARNRKHKEVGP
jgi:hypothetical protein